MQRKLFLLPLLFLPVTSAFATDTPFVEMQTNLGTISIELDYKNAPITCANFAMYANDKFYNNTIFHRVISGFVVQGGGFSKATKQNKIGIDPTDTTKTQQVRQDPNDPTKLIKVTPITNEANTSGLSNLKGTISMARTNDANSATSQFFINLVDNDHDATIAEQTAGQSNTNLNYAAAVPATATTAAVATKPGYAAFGKVINGMSIAQNMAKLSNYNGLPFTANDSLVYIENVYLSAAPDTTKSLTRVSINGAGKVTSSPSGIKCSTSSVHCSVTKPASTTKKITLTATAFPNYVFNGWTGDCQGYKKTITLDLKSNHNCTATFTK